MDGIEKLRNRLNNFNIVLTILILDLKNLSKLRQQNLNMNYVVRCLIKMREIFMYGITEIGFHPLIHMVKRMNSQKRRYYVN
jgi:hypothetical protein